VAGKMLFLGSVEICVGALAIVQRCHRFTCAAVLGSQTMAIDQITMFERMTLRLVSPVLWIGPDCLGIHSSWRGPRVS
jgi:hypothetical protein